MVDSGAEQDLDKFRLTAPVLNFPKNDIVSSSYAGQIANAHARVVTGFARSLWFGFCYL